MERDERMTYYLHEEGVVVCDVCGREEASYFHKGSPAIQDEERFFEELMDKGWKYDQERGEHTCPKCNLPLVERVRKYSRMEEEINQKVREEEEGEKFRSVYRRSNKKSGSE